MIGSLFAGVSGLNANAIAMTVIGDNIANVNTTGFKSNRASFANILSQSLEGSTGSEIGRGVYFWGITPLWSQGSLETTSNPTDLAINGRGFFIVRDDSGASYYTRAGEFRFDKDGNLLNPDGLVVQGYKVDSNGTIGSIGNITIPLGNNPPRATDEMRITLNLDAEAVNGDTYSSTITVYDSLGNDIPLTITFTKTANPLEWNWAASIPATVGSVSSGSGTIAFNADGTLPNGTDPTISIDLTNGASTPLDIAWDLYDDVSGVTNGDVTGYSSPFTTTFMTQNGYPAGTLQSVSVDEKGVIAGLYSNGQMDFYQLALADFPTCQGLSKMGNSLYSETMASGEAMPGIPGSGRLGTISPNSLELSNVDLASEFVKMITTQRAFQANSKVITTSDEILADLINIKR